MVDGMGFILLTSSRFAGCGVAVRVVDIHPLNFPSYRVFGRCHMVS